MKAVERLRAINGGQKAEIDYLGCLLWFTISDLRIPVEDLKQALEDSGLGEKFMPGRISPRDAWRRATKTVESKREPHEHEQGVYRNLLVREVCVDDDKLVRQLVREVVDGQNVRLDYRPIAQLEIRAEDDYAIIPMTDDLTDGEQAALDSIPDRYREALECHDGRHTRYMLKNILLTCSPVSVRPSGGVYFIPQKHVDTVSSMKSLAKKLADYSTTTERTRMWSIPVIDAEEHREMVEESLEEQVVGGSLTLIKEMQSIMKDADRKITTKAAQGYAEKVKQLKKLVAEYEDILEMQATRARENLELARLQAVKFMEQIDEAATA